MISKIYIENYRSIERLTMCPQKLCAIIGPNSSGKTNVLKALDTMLGEIYPTERAFSKDDFYKRDVNKIITIQIWFSEPLRPCKLTPKGATLKESCQAISLKLTHTKNKDVYFRTTFTAINSDGKEFYGSGEVRDQMNFIYISSERHLDKQMSVTQWSILGKILQKIDENFRKKDDVEEYSELEEDFRTAMDEPRRILESEFPDGLSYKRFKEVFTTICKENTEGLANSFNLDLQIYDPLFYYKTIQLIGKEEFGDFNVHELGSGVQNLVLLALFRTYARLMKNQAILAIEEPEIYLYPQAQRQLFKSFIEISNAFEGEGTQIFYTTHNPNFIDVTRANEIEILQKDSKHGTKSLPKNPLLTAMPVEKFKAYTHFNTERNELFFAKKVILVEGDSDKIMWTTLLEEKWKIAVDKEGISIIECGGKLGVLYFIGVCRLMSIEYFSIWDEDDGCDSIIDSHNLFPVTIAEGRGLQVEGNLEMFLRNKFPEEKYPQFSFSQSNKVENAFTWASEIDVESIPEEFRVVQNFAFPNSTDKQKELSV